MFGKYIHSFLYTISSFLVLLLLTTTLSYFDLINDNITNIINLIISVISLAAGGFVMAKNSYNKGYIEGLKWGIIMSIIILIIDLIFLKYKFSIKSIIFFVSLIVSAMLGGMIGINFSTEVATTNKI